MTTKLKTSRIDVFTKDKDPNAAGLRAFERTMLQLSEVTAFKHKHKRLGMVTFLVPRGKERRLTTKVEKTEYIWSRRVKAGSPLVQFEAYIKNMPRKELAGLIKIFVAEANHNNWDGAERRDLAAIGRLFEDIIRFHKVAVESDETPHPFSELCSTNPVE